MFRLVKGLRGMLVASPLAVAPISTEVGSMLHYHIRWADGKLDWEAFPTEEEARLAAKQLMRPEETYVIMSLDGNCSRCTGFQSQSGWGSGIGRMAE